MVFLSAVWTLILTAPIHCRGSSGVIINFSKSVPMKKLILRVNRILLSLVPASSLFEGQLLHMLTATLGFFVLVPKCSVTSSSNSSLIQTLLLCQ